MQVVKGGAPCHLYFDTEFATECNPGVDGEALLDKLLLACTRVFRYSNVPCHAGIAATFTQPSVVLWLCKLTHMVFSLALNHS